MIDWLKRTLYFAVSRYFRFWATLRLKRWQPKIVVVTASSGKTTCLSMIEAQIGARARYSHHANSAIGVPFDILGLKRQTLLVWEWPKLFLLAPLNAFKKAPVQKLYIVEADCDRPGEGLFLATLLTPEITIWLNSTQTHAMNFDKLIQTGRFSTIEKAISFEFGYFIEYTKNTVIVNGDSKVILEELHRTHAKVYKMYKETLNDYRITRRQSHFTIAETTYSFNGMLPPDAFYSLEATRILLKLLRIKEKPDFESFNMPPGRGRIFRGIRKTILFDSCYNANLSSMANVLTAFSSYPGTPKWMVLGDMLELGSLEKEAHTNLADLAATVSASHIILLGPRVRAFTYPRLVTLLEGKIPIVTFDKPPDVLNYLKKNLTGGEIILFKGARFMEGIIENLLTDKNDTKFLSRRETAWQKRRQKWGL